MSIGLWSKERVERLYRAIYGIFENLKETPILSVIKRIYGYIW
jgi:hypothetical protein